MVLHIFIGRTYFNICIIVENNSIHKYIKIDGAVHAISEIRTIGKLREFQSSYFYFRIYFKDGEYLETSYVHNKDNRDALYKKLKTEKEKLDLFFLSNTIECTEFFNDIK